MAKDVFNTVSAPPQPAFEPQPKPSFFSRDRHNREIRTEEDYAIGSRILGDGTRVQLRNGKILSASPDPAQRKEQEEKKSALCNSEERRTQREKTQLDVKARNFQL